jgi:hypothetical protein
MGSLGNNDHSKTTFQIRRSIAIQVKFKYINFAMIFVCTERRSYNTDSHYIIPFKHYFGSAFFVIISAVLIAIFFNF